MYIDADVIIRAGAVVSALAVMVGFIISAAKIVLSLKNQLEELRKAQETHAEQMRDIREEQRILCKGLKGTLEGLIERGCDGPCKDALVMLNDHLNAAAHED